MDDLVARGMRYAEQLAKYDNPEWAGSVLAAILSRNEMAVDTAFEVLDKFLAKHPQPVPELLDDARNSPDD